MKTNSPPLPKVIGSLEQGNVLTDSFQKRKGKGRKGGEKAQSLQDGGDPLPKIERGRNDQELRQKRQDKQEAPGS